jgi:YgiT-type zinc finger domain-containing protein
MLCVICKNGKTRPGKRTVTLERDGTTLIVRRVPAEICENCGEEYVDEAAATSLLKIAEEAAQAGAHMDIREFVVA